MASADLLLHPVRLRVVQAFLGDRALTTSQLGAELPDVPPASLYRHVARLVDAGVLSVVAERRVRGATERTYVLRTSAASVDLDELATMTNEQYREMFLAFVAGLIGDFDRYLDKGDADLRRDGVGFRLAGMWLTDDELKELSQEFLRVLQPRLANAPTAARRRWILGSIFLPGEEGALPDARASASPPRVTGAPKTKP